MLVCGDDALAMRIVEELNSAGMSVVKLTAAAQLADAGVGHATALICAGDDDALNLEIALLARKSNPDIRVVARLDNSVLRAAMAADNGPGAILDVADLAAPSVVEACLGRDTHAITVAGVEFFISGTDAPRHATLRQLYGELVPVAVVHGDNSPTPGEVVACPSRDLRVHPGDWTAMMGTADELAAQGITVAEPTAGVRRAPLIRVVNTIRTYRDDVNPMFFRALAAMFTLFVGSALLLWFAYREPPMSFLDALYFSAETLTTVGYGDFSFLHQPDWLRLWGIVMMFAGVSTTAILVAFIADLLLSRRFAQSAERRRARFRSNHVVVVGLGSFGIRVVSDLNAAGYDVVAIDRDENGSYRSVVNRLGVPVVFGDARLRETLLAAGVRYASAVAVLTQDDMVNIETGIVLRETLRAHRNPTAGRPRIPLVLRIFDRSLGAAVAQRFGFAHVRSTVELAAPWFIGAAMGLQVIGTFSVGQRSFMVGGVRIEAGSELDGLPIAERATQSQVLAIVTGGGDFKLYPYRDTRIAAGDTAYLVGPYRELLATLGKGQRTPRGSAPGARTG